jgi:hypothetical protein
MDDQAAFVKSYDDGIQDNHAELDFLDKPPIDSIMPVGSQDTRADEEGDDEDEEEAEERKPFYISDLNKELREAALKPQVRIEAFRWSRDHFLTISVIG